MAWTKAVTMRVSICFEMVKACLSSVFRAEEDNVPETGRFILLISDITGRACFFTLLILRLSSEALAEKGFFLLAIAYILP